MASKVEMAIIAEELLRGSWRVALTLMLVRARLETFKSFGINLRNILNSGAGKPKKPHGQGGIW